MSAWTSISIRPQNKLRNIFFSVHPYANEKHATRSLCVILCNALIKQLSLRGLFFSNCHLEMLRPFLICGKQHRIRARWARDSGNHPSCRETACLIKTNPHITLQYTHAWLIILRQGHFYNPFLYKTLMVFMSLIYCYQP